MTGLAVNSYGGNTLPIEVSLSEGTGRVTLTGSLGDVMQESAQAALTYARANARKLGLAVSYTHLDVYKRQIMFTVAAYLLPPACLNDTHSVGAF